MGTLRFLLAACVVAFHAGPIFGLRGMGAEAVPAFFVLSGFYMSLILETKYRGAALTFYGNRILRLFPMYWAFLLLIAAFAMLPSMGVTAWDALGYTSRMQLTAGSQSWLAVVPNLLIVGSDWLRQVYVDPADGTLHWWLRTVPEGPRLHGLYNHLVIPQIWSVGVELTFYALAPALVLLRTRTLVIVCIAARVFGPMLTAHLAYEHMLPNVNFWYFLLGMIAYRTLPKVAAAPRYQQMLVAAIPFAVLVAWPLLVTDPNARVGLNLSILILIFALGIPSLFLLSQSNDAFEKVDRRIGDLSYPLYITHLLFAFPASGFGAYSGLVCLLLSMLVSTALLVVVQAPVDRLRAQMARPTFAQ